MLAMPRASRPGPAETRSTELRARQTYRWRAWPAARSIRRVAAGPTAKRQASSATDSDVKAGRLPAPRVIGNCGRRLSPRDPCVWQDWRISTIRIGAKNAYALIPRTWTARRPPSIS